MRDRICYAEHPPHKEESPGRTIKVFLNGRETKAFPGPELMRMEKCMKKSRRLITRGIPNMYTPLRST